MRYVMLMPLLFCGCAFLEEEAPQIEAMSEQVAELAPIVGAVNPAAGYIALAVAGGLGLLGGIAKVLSKKKG